MTNQEAADELQYAINLIKQDGKDWLDERDIPILETAISALQAQESPKPTAELVQNVKDDDLVSRKVAIDAINKALDRETLLNSFVRKVAVDALKTMPSAQSEPCEDAVSRKAAIDAALSAFSRGLIASPDIRKLPSVQPKIIRCKDCKYIQKLRSEESAKKFGQIYECARSVLNCPRQEDFCSYAERRTDE